MKSCERVQSVQYANFVKFGHQLISPRNCASEACVLRKIHFGVGMPVSPIMPGLLKRWDAQNPVHLIGHSFGGNTAAAR
jgi:hypothetical protein